jgi:hypothetical protein
VACLALLTLALFGDVLFQNGLVVSRAGEDLTVQYISWRELAFTELRAGNLPLWNPYIFSGAPFFGGFQSALLYPINWLHLLLPVGQGINCEVALHFLIAALSMHVWVRRRGGGPLRSMLAGAVYALSPPFFAHIVPGHLSNLGTMAWAPAIFAVIDALIAAPTVATAAVGAVIVALQITAGHPQYVYYTGLAAALYAATRLRHAPRLWPTLAALAVIYAGAVALTSVQLLSGIEASAESVRAGGTDYDFASSFYFPPASLLTLISPLLFGGALGREYYAPFNYWEMTLYLGCAGGLLALLGAAAELRRRELSLVLPAAATLLLALGKTTPLYRLLYDALPGIGMFRGISKFIFLTALFSAPLVARGVDVLVDLAPRRRRLLGAALTGIGVAVWGALRLVDLGGGALAVWTSVLPHLRDVTEMLGDGVAIPRSYVLGSLECAAGAVMVAAGMLALFGAACLTGRRRLGWALAALVVADMALMARLQRPVQDIAAFNAARAAYAKFVDHFSPDARTLTAHDPNIGMAVRRGGIWGSDPFVTKRYAELMAHVQGLGADAAAQDLDIRTLDHPALRLLRFLPLFTAGGGLDAAEVDAPRKVLPRFWLVHRYEVQASRDGVLGRVSDAGFDPEAQVVLESEPDVRPALAGTGTVRVLGEDTDRFELEVDLSGSAILVASENYSAGWRATALAGSDQSAYSVLPADYVLRAIPLRAGHHHLELEYRPRLFDLGLGISSAALAALAGVILWSLARRRLPGRGQRGPRPERGVDLQEIPA